MSEPERRKRGIKIISMHSILRLLGMGEEYKAISMRISRTDRSMLEITIAHPDLPEWSPGSRIKRIENDVYDKITIVRRYEEKE